ncbi:hypothetical protein Anas_08037, partial [Armadillidium nasatum]
VYGAIYCITVINLLFLKTNHIYLPIVKIIEGKNTNELKVVFKAELSECKFFTESDLTFFRLNKRALEVIGQNKHLSFGSSAYVLLPWNQIKVILILLVWEQSPVLPQKKLHHQHTVNLHHMTAYQRVLHFDQ